MRSGGAARHRDPGIVPAGTQNSERIDNPRVLGFVRLSGERLAVGFLGHAVFAPKERRS
jgi:hypothetical protein